MVLPKFYSSSFQFLPILLLGESFPQLMPSRRRPRALTLTLPDEKQPFLVLEGQRYTLRNFSEEGIGLWVPAPAPFGLATGSKISGDIVIGNSIHPVKLEIVHHSSRIVGLRITQKSLQLSGIFRELLEPAVHAAELRVQPGSGQDDPESGYAKLWYRSATGTELLLWYDSQKMIQAIQLCWLGKWLFRQQFRHPLTGHLKDDPRQQTGTKVSDAELLLKHPEPDEEIINQAAQFLGAAPPPLPGYKLWQFLEMGEQVRLPDELFSTTKVA